MWKCAINSVSDVQYNVNLHNSGGRNKFHIGLESTSGTTLFLLQFSILLCDDNKITTILANIAMSGIFSVEHRQQTQA